VSPWEQDLARWRARDEVWRANLSATLAGVVLLLSVVLLPVLPWWGWVVLGGPSVMAVVVMVSALDDRRKARRELER
jgi:UDP-N-acetylmuramyl pentapeptide phosphotransferase/UDP-N-acetylglucosamine-1-phosphate transferase